jgi:RNA polymerase sigma-70 factor (ECF subfamily)
MRPSAPSGPGSTEDPREEYLLRWQQSGDRDALDHLLRIEVLSLRSWLRRSRRGATPSASASDIAQQAVAQFLRSSKRSATDERPVFENPRALRGFLWTTALRLLKDHARRRRVAVVHFDRHSATSSCLAEPEASGGLDAVEQSDVHVKLSLLVNLLGETDREMLKLHYFDELPIPEIASRLAIAPTAVHQRLVRARKNLRDRLGSWTDLLR